MTRKCESILREVLIELSVVITDDVGRVAAALDVDQERGVVNKGLDDLPGVHDGLLLHPVQVGPVRGLEPRDGSVVCELYLGRVGDPDLVTLEYLRRAPFLATGPGTVTLPVPQLVVGDLTKH